MKKFRKGQTVWVKGKFTGEGIYNDKPYWPIEVCIDECDDLLGPAMDELALTVNSTRIRPNVTKKQIQEYCKRWNSSETELCDLLGVR